MKKVTLLLLCLLANIVGAKAQIGYQISLLNTATGEARANETVNVSVSLSNKDGEVFYSETKSATTNDFGVLSLSIGNADTFKDVDLTKMPFFIEVTANDVLIGKSQILSVPVAEVAKRIAPIDKSEILGTWLSLKSRKKYTLTFKEDGTCESKSYRRSYDTGEWYEYDLDCWSGSYEIYGDIIFLSSSSNDYSITCHYFDKNIIFDDNNKYIKQ